MVGCQSCRINDLDRENVITKLGEATNLGPDSFFNGIQMGAPLQKKNQVVQ
jgi:hypothetical protein